MSKFPDRRDAFAEDESLRHSRIAEQIVNYLLLIGSPVILLAVWQLAGDRGVLNLSIVPTPKTILDALVAFTVSGRLADYFLASFVRVVAGFAIGAGSGLLIGALGGISVKFAYATAVVLGVLRPIPMIGLLPLFILWFGIDEWSKILVIAMGAIWPVLLNTEGGIRNVDPKHIEVARILMKDKATVLRKIIFPSAVPSLLTGLRLGFSTAWRGIVASEMIGASAGVGYLISYARELSQPAVMFLGLFIIGTVGILIDIVLQRLEKRLLRWV
ncbi:MAG: ABC transporter permease [Clostridiales Family XIII bacterium]|jgi:sulfonate transport system permease protein|nr:ABC transporter permease [Clostridiales Family XIII bacterium]